MILNCKIKIKKSESKIFKKDNFWIIEIKSSPEKGKANKEIIKIIAEYFSIPKDKVIIIKGKKSQNKIIEIK